MTMFSRRILKVEFRHSKRFLPTTNNGWVHWLITWRLISYNTGYQGWLLESEADKADKTKTDVVSHHRLYHFIRMLIGLKNAPATLQQIMDLILSTVNWKNASVYLDYIVIFSIRLWNTLTVLNQYFVFLKNAGVTLNLKKRAFFINRIDHLDHVTRYGNP